MLRYCFVEAFIAGTLPWVVSLFLPNDKLMKGSRYNDNEGAVLLLQRHETTALAWYFEAELQKIGFSCN